MKLLTVIGLFLDLVGRITGPPQAPRYAALLLTSTLFPTTYVAYLPIGMQAATLGAMAKLARRLGYPTHLMPTPA